MTLQSETKYFEFALLILLAILWGSSFTWIKIAVETIPPATIVASRVTVAAVVLLFIMFWKQLSFPLSFSTWITLFVQGSLQSAIPFTLISWSEKYIDSGLAGVLNSTPPLFVFLISLVILRSADGVLQKSIGVTVGLVGVVLVMGPEAITTFGDTALAQIAVLGASFSYGCAALFGKRFSEMPTLATAACTMLTATIIMVPIALISDRPWALTPTVEAVLATAMLALFSTALAMLIFFRLLKTLGPLRTTSNAYLRAVFSVALGVVFLDEIFTIQLAAGIFLVFVGVAIVNEQIRLPWHTVPASDANKQM